MAIREDNAANKVKHSMVGQLDGKGQSCYDID